VRFLKINRAPNIGPVLAVSGMSRPLVIPSEIAGLTTPFLRVLPTVLFCLTLTGAADATASRIGN